VSPAQVTLAPGAVRQFSATLSGQPVANVVWSAAGGTIDQTGRFTAGPTPGTFEVRAANATGSSGTAIVVIAASEEDVLLESVTVPVNGTSVISTTVLAAGVTYTLRASGTFRVGGPGDGLADAEYANFASPPASLLDACTTAPVDIGIAVNGAKRRWGAFSPAHLYEITIDGTGTPVSFHYQDCNPRDNSGSLRVDIFGPTP
jgi:hypothetical protein